MTVEFDFSGVRTRFIGLEPQLDERLCREWQAFASQDREASDRTVLKVTCHTGDPLPEPGPFLPKTMRHRFLENRAEFSMPEGQVVVTSDGHAALELYPVDAGRDFYTLCNLHRAALSWWLPRRAGLLIHAAGIVVDGRGYLMIGAHGAGKTTWANLALEAGCHVVSDDLLIIDSIDECPTLVAAPLRSTLRFDYRTGRWPLAGMLLPQHGETHELEPVGGIAVHASLTANLPFINDAAAVDPIMAQRVDQLAASVPCSRLTFARDPGYLTLLKNWP